MRDRVWRKCLKNEVFQLKWGLKFIFLQFWVPSARFICKNTTFQKNTFSLGWSWNFDLFWGPREPYGAFRDQNSHKMQNFQYIKLGMVLFCHILLIFWYGKEKTAIFLLKPKKFQGGSLRPPPVGQGRYRTPVGNRVKNAKNCYTTFFFSRAIILVPFL